MTSNNFSTPAFAGLFVAALAALSGCAASPGPAPAPAVASATEPAPFSAVASAQAHVDALIGDAACDTQDQCHSVGVGAKACGGPERYLPWSDKVTDRNALQQAVQAQVEASRADNERNHRISNCMMAREPTAVCRPRASDGKKSCQLGQGGVGSAI